MFRLIDSILPFEACLYYQFLPLALEGRHLKLGMVVPQDSSALDYVRHILAYLNCSLKTEQITASTHQVMLSAYLNHSHASSAPKKLASQKKHKLPRSEQPTLILDDALEPESKATDLPPTPTPSSEPSSTVPAQRSRVPSPIPPKLPSEKSEGEVPSTAMIPTPVALPPVEALPLLDVQARYLSQPIEFIATLAPQQLLQELLGRVLLDGIGRLYFERQADQGRILWSQDGVLQSVIERLTLPVFQGVIIELKRVVQLPLLPVIQPKQVEVERRYQQESLLLRLRVMPGTHGEEATLQVLRGVALKFYQRQQLEKLSQDALKLAQQLQRKLNEIRDRSVRHPAPIETLPALNQMLQGLDKQLKALTALQASQPSDNSLE
ncbi:MAG: hypothetical protein F6K28_15375 [Microcoleus sp. SIO2G3]|nr:hypothetical protein [Microcoleus sp. SIO2G3]